jgi:hypothetical protein
MPYAIEEHEEENGHRWARATATCNLDDPADALIAETVALVRRSYGEDEIMKDAVAVLDFSPVSRTKSDMHCAGANIVHGLMLRGKLSRDWPGSSEFARM